MNIHILHIIHMFAFNYYLFIYSCVNDGSMCESVYLLSIKNPINIRILPMTVDSGTITPVTITSVIATAGIVNMTPTAANTGFTRAITAIKVAL